VIALKCTYTTCSQPTPTFDSAAKKHKLKSGLPELSHGLYKDDKENQKKMRGFAKSANFS
jgi:hypothetical protein